MWKIEFPTPAPCLQKPDHNNQAIIIPQGKPTCSVYLIERKGWQRCKQKGEKWAQSILYLSMCSWHGSDPWYWNGTGCGERGLLRREGWGRMKVRQTTRNFSLLNFNLLDKNNSKWGTEYAWGREGILSFSGDSSLNGIANYVSHCSVQFS